MKTNNVSKFLVSVLWICAASTTLASEMIQVPAGSFKMPAILNQKEIKVDAFQMDKHPVTNAQYLDFVKKNPQWKKSKIKKLFSDGSYLQYWTSDESFGDADSAQAPVVRVSWYAAREYCSSLNKRLPLIDEWEYVALMPFKNKEDIKTVVLDWYGSSAQWPLPSVQSKQPNKIGVYDMHGLIWEWVEDFNSSLVTGESRADGALDKNLFCGAGAVGADPSDYAAFMRLAFRSSLQARYTVQNLGFRCVK